MKGSSFKQFLVLKKKNGFLHILVQIIILVVGLAHFKLNKPQIPHNYVQNSPKIAPKPWMFAGGKRTDTQNFGWYNIIHLSGFVVGHKNAI